MYMEMTTDTRVILSVVSENEVYALHGHTNETIVHQVSLREMPHDNHGAWYCPIATTCGWLLAHCVYMHSRTFSVSAEYTFERVRQM